MSRAPRFSSPEDADRWLDSPEGLDWLADQRAEREARKREVEQALGEFFETLRKEWDDDRSKWQ